MRYPNRLAITFTILLIALVCSMPRVLASDDDSALTGKEIVQKVIDKEEPTSSKADVKMILVNKRGDKRIREIILYRMEIDDLTRTMIRFLKPDDVRGTGFLVRERKNEDDEQFLYLPALGKVKRIASSQKSSSFMGTDFTYEDLQSTDLREDDEHKRLADETINGQDCYVVETIPSKERDSQYSRLVNWIRKDNLIPIKTEFYDKKGKLLKVMEVKKLDKVDGYWTPLGTLMRNVQKDHQTLLVVDSVSNKAELSEEYFTERYLENPL